jgi:DNA mismatch repair protein MutS
MPTPARRQYLEIKAQHPDALLAYQVGDFFEFFDRDAQVAARALQIALTSRAYGPGERVPLAGVPLHAIETYTGRLVAQGFKVAICEQMEPPGRGLVRRAVTRVLTPGTVVEPGLLPTGRDNYLVAVARGQGRAAGAAGLAYVEASTGTFACAEWPAGALPDALRAEIERLRPAEVLVSEARSSTEAPDERAPWAEVAEWAQVTPCPPHYFDRESSRVRLCRHFATPTLAAFGCEGLALATAAAGAILAYLERMNPALLRLIDGLTTYHTTGFVEVDGRTWNALEAVEPARGSASGRTLLATLDATRTAMGARLLRRTLLLPLKDRAALEARLDAVAALHADAAIRQRLGGTLDGLPDLERLMARVVQGTATARELHALAATLARVADVKSALAGHADGALATTIAALDPCAAVDEAIAAALAQPDTDDGRVLRRGYSAELDALVDSIASSRRWIAALERSERERTGIKSLRVTYNQVFGYAIEVTRPNLARVPPEYERRQTLATGERFVTPALKEREARVLQAEERIAALERELYVALLAQLAAYHARVRTTAAALAQLDVWLALAGVAVVRGYVRPELTEDLTLEVRDGRHPVVEAALDGAEFIANDTLLGGRSEHPEAAEDTPGRVLLVTGPNMAGKSTYLRQVAQIVLLAQVGSFVPARRARIGLVDRIFTRVGADDDLARGISTFMREMTETAYILRHATERSLVVLDEVGRGTSTHDGLAIARAVVEYLHDYVGARTLFATHFHELADLADALPRMQLAAMQVQERDGQVVFLHRLGPGRAYQSYGVHVARMAGLPGPVTARAAELLAAPPGAGRSHGGEMRTGPHREDTEGAEEAQLAMLREPGRGDRWSAVTHLGEATPAREIVLGLASLNVAAMTPMEAINLLFSLQQRAAAALHARHV